MLELKRLFEKVQRDAKSVLFTEETTNDKLLKILKKSKYDKDIGFVNLLKSNIDFLDDEKISIPIKTTFVEKKMILIGLPSITLIVLFNYYMLTVEIRVFFEKLPPTSNIFSCLLTFSHQRYMFIQWSLEDFWQTKWDFFIKKLKRKEKVKKQDFKQARSSNKRK